MKKFKIEIILMGVLAMIFASCSDFFEPNNDTTLNGDRYIKEGSELYSGFLGIITKIQAIGDKASGEKGCLLKKIRKKLVFLIYKTVLCRVVL